MGRQPTTDRKETPTVKTGSYERDLMRRLDEKDKIIEAAICVSAEAAKAAAMAVVAESSGDEDG